MTPSSDSVDAGWISLNDAADELGVHYMTAYRYVRTGRMIAAKRQGKWWVTTENLAAVVQAGTGVRRRPASSVAPRELLVGPLASRMVAGDTAGCWDLIADALSGGATPSEVHQRLLRGALEDIGARWESGEVSIGDEHRATATAYRLIGQLGPLFRSSGRRRGTVVIGAVAGDSHALPSAMLTDLVAARRFDVVDLGANAPTEAFLDAAGKADGLVGVGLCATLDEAVPTLMAQTAEMHAAFPDTYVVVGGGALRHADARMFEDIADCLSRSAAEACEAFEAAAATKPVSTE